MTDKMIDKLNVKTKEIRVDINILETIDLLEMISHFKLPKKVIDKIQKLLNYLYDSYLPLPETEKDIEVIESYLVHVDKYIEI